MATSEGIPSSIDIEFLELNDNPYSIPFCFLMLPFLYILDIKSWIFIMILSLNDKFS